MRCRVTPLARRTCMVPVSKAIDDHCRSHSSDTRKPWRKPIRIIVASRWPWRLPLAAFIKRSSSVRCSRSRPMSRLLRRRSVTVRNFESGGTSRRFDFAMILAPALM
jgi:hypothetical protein